MTILRPTSARPSSPGGPDDRQTVPVGHRIAGRCRVDGVLGHGGMATVLAARDLVLGRDVAVKVLARAEVGADDLLDREMRLGAGMQHPAVTAVFDGGTADVDGRRVSYLVMEQLPLGDLRRHLLMGRMRWRDTAWVGADLADGLAHMHAQGYLHRDVKPANILIAGRDASGRLRAKLTDLGIASPPSPDDQAVERTLGTAAYIGPEQVEGADPTDRSDVYALGLVLLEALQGVVEFPGDVHGAALGRLRRDPAIPAGLPAPLAHLLSRMTDRSPLQRPSAAAVSERLRDLLLGDLARRSASPRSAADRAAAAEEALGRYDVLGWPPRRAFTASTTLAARLLHARWACVVLADVDRLHVTALTGRPDLPATLTSWDWLVDPARVDPWFVGDLGERPPTGRATRSGRDGLRSLACAPLVTLHGDLLGSLCVFDDRTRAFSEQELAELAALASMIVSELELRLATRRAILSR